MTEFLTLSRAARLVGVTRGELQKRIRDNELETFEGQVGVSDLLRAFPEAHLEDDSALERVNRIKAAAMPRREEIAELPSPEVLATRLARLSRELTEAKSEIGTYSSLVTTLGDRLAALERLDDAALRPEVQALAQWLGRELERRPKVPKRQAQFLARDTFLRLLAAQVKVIPGGREFFVEGTDSILDAAVRAGLALCYGCEDGSCGSCKARVVAGEVLKVRDHDYEISPTEHSLGYILMCSYTAVTDLTIEAAEAHRSEDIPPQTIYARVRQIMRPSDDLAILSLQTPPTQRLRFLAGQRVTLTLEDGAAADLPLASCPCDGGNLEIHIRRHGSSPSPFTDAVLGGRIQPGHPVTAHGPHGNFVLDEETTHPILFFAYDEGFGPIKSLIENAISIENAESYHLYWLVSAPGGHYMDNRCRAWTDALDNFDYTPRVLGLDEGPQEPTGALAASISELEEIAQCEVYAAGPPPFLDTLQALLARHGMPPGQLHLEQTL
jgi:CDP-4-dehydro-6-deoxyglucose reductase